MTADATGLAKGVQRCTVPGCTGTIEDGYCNVCGTPAGAMPRARPERSVRLRAAPARAAARVCPTTRARPARWRVPTARSRPAPR